MNLSSEEKPGCSYVVKGDYEIARDGKHPRCHQPGFHGIFLKSWLNSPFSHAPLHPW